MDSEYDILNGLTAKQRERVNQLAERKTFDARSFIIRDGSQADCFFIVHKGKVTILKNGIALASIKPGMHFGLMALIDGSQRSADALAEMNTTLLLIPYSSISSRENSDIYQHILNNQLRVQQKQLRLMNDFTVSEVQKKAADYNYLKSSFDQRAYYESLLKEIHHRVKNNLQTVSSMLYLQSRHIEDSDAKEAILASQRRVDSMALIHKTLYQRENLAELEMKSYITQLAHSLIEAHSSNEKDIELDIDMEEVLMTVEKAIPIGLIINELIINSLKYAFNDGSGTISIQMVKRKNDTFSLKVADNGQGKITERKGFGTQLISILVRQIEGQINEYNSDGYTFNLEF